MSLSHSLHFQKWGQRPHKVGPNLVGVNLIESETSVILVDLLKIMPENAVQLKSIQS